MQLFFALSNLKTLNRPQKWAEFKKITFFPTKIDITQEKCHNALTLGSDNPDLIEVTSLEMDIIHIHTPFTLVCPRKP